MSTKESTAVARRPQSPNGLAARDPIQLAEHFARSGYFKDAGDLSKAVVKIVAGEELGIGPMGSMQGIHIIEGKPSLSANLLAGLVKRHPAYDYKVREHTAESCRIEFFQDGESAGDSTFTVEDAKTAGVYRQNWQKYPKAMLFARALSQGVRWHCPDVTAGSPAYVPEELGAEVTEEGEPVATLPPPSDDEPVTGEVVEQNGTITKARAEQIVKAAREVGVESAKLRLAAVGIAKRDLPEFSTVKQARESLSLLSGPEADELDAWLSGKADAGAGDE